MYIDSNTDTSSVTGLMVGHPMSFSDTTVKLASSEVRGMTFARTATLSDITFMKPEQAAMVRLIVVDKSQAEALRSTLPKLRETFPNATFALAFRRLDTAQQYLACENNSAIKSEIGFLPMDLNIDCWLSVLHLLSCGQKYVPANLTALAPQEAPENKAPRLEPEQSEAAPEVDAAPSDINLTDRELQVLRAVSEGKQNKIIADELDLSQHTVKLHMHHVIAKLGVHNRTEAAVWYLARQNHH